MHPITCNCVQCLFGLTFPTGATATAMPTGATPPIPGCLCPLCAPLRSTRVGNLTRLQQEHERGFSHKFNVDLYGYRCWTVIDNLLYPIASQTHTPYPRGVQVSQCKLYRNEIPKHEAPHPMCRCGFYSYANPHEFAKQDIPMSEVYVAGVVRLSGTIIQHRKGYRAAKQEIVALSPVNTERLDSHLVPDPIVEYGQIILPALKGAGAYYGVPTFDDWNKMIMEHPMTHLEGLE